MTDPLRDLSGFLGSFKGSFQGSLEAPRRDPLKSFGKGLLEGVYGRLRAPLREFQRLVEGVRSYRFSVWGLGFRAEFESGSSIRGLHAYHRYLRPPQPTFL